MIEGVDASYDWPTVPELVAAGKRFAVGYVSTVGHAKNMTAARARALQAAGLGVCIVGEISAGRALGGYKAGVADMQSFAAQVADLGGPPDSVIYQAVDFDVTGMTVKPATLARRELAAMLLDVPSPAQRGDPDALGALGAFGARIAEAHAAMVADQMPTVLGYLRGGAAVRGANRTGPYGERDVVAAAFGAGFGYGWGTYAWSHGLRDPRAQLWQYRNNVALGSGTVDLDQATQADYGQWNRQEADVSYENWTDAGRKALLDDLGKLIKVLVTEGDEPEPPTGDTHPNNLKRIRKELAAKDVTLSAAQLDAIIAAMVAAVSRHPAPTYATDGPVVLVPQQPA